MKIALHSLLSTTAIAAISLLGESLSVANAQETAESEATMDTVFVSGRRVSQVDEAIGLDQATNTVAVTREELLSAPAGISGLKMLETLPGFNVQTDGALGLYEFGNSVTTRAFRLQQIGFVLDGIPMGRSDPFGGSPIFRYVDNENLASVVASPGAGDVSLPSYNSLGPIVSYNSIAPSEEVGGIASISGGDDDLLRTFLKLETGKIGGFSAYFSRSTIDSDLWRGAGTIDREHLEGKARYEFDSDTFLEAKFVYNDFFDFDSPSFSRETYESSTPTLDGDTGRDRGYIDFVPDGCNIGVETPVDFNNDGVVDDDDFQPISVGGICTQYFIDRVNVREDALSSLMFETDLMEDVTMNALIYYEDKDGFGVSPDGYSNTLGRYNDQIAVGLDVTHPRGIQYGLSTVGGDRKGATLGFTWDIANHSIEFGGWYEEDSYRRQQLRLNKTAGSPAGEVIFDEVAYFRRDYVSTREAIQYYVKDTISLMNDKLSVEVGFKGLDVDYELDGFRDFNDYARRGAGPNGETLPGFGPQVVGDTYTDGFLPMIGAVYDLNNTDQVFASYSENFALPREADTIFDDAVGFDAPAPEGEESQNFEIGFRTNRPSFNGAIAVFYTSFDNRIVTDSVLNPATNQPETFSVNAGETTAYGFELSGVYQPDFFNDQVYADFNLTYNKTELEDGFGPNPAGSQLADAPEWVFTGGVTYEPTEWLVANISTKYTGERFADFQEAATQPGNEMDSYFLWSGYLDLGGPNNFGLPENVSLRFNVDNIFDEDTLAFTFTTAGNGNAFYRPLNPRTFQATATVQF
ncbi:MAG: TonB-dependent receptor [Pseudomonadota bacterium]